MKKISLFGCINTIIMLILCIVFLYPFIYLLSVSLSDSRAILSGDVFLFPIGFNIEAYKALFRDSSIINSFFVTIRITVFGVFLSMVMLMMTAYPLSKSKIPGMNTFMKLIIVTMYFSGGIIPNYILIKQLGLINTIGSVILPIAIDTFTLILVINFFRGLPAELEEAATIDGCNTFQVFYKIIVPLSKPIMATVVIFTGVAFWNTFFSALMYIQNPKMYPLQVKLYQMLNVFTDSNPEQLSSTVIAENLKGAVVVFTVLPIIIIYPLLQKHYVKGAMVGAIKS